MPRINDLDTRYPALITSPLSKLLENLPGGFALRENDEDDRKICDFYARYKFWIFDQALGLLEADDPHIRADSGFAVITLLTPYFDVLGRLRGTSQKYTDWDSGKTKTEPGSEVRIKDGLTFVFEELEHHPDKDHVCNMFYGKFRTGVAHVGFPGKVILDNDFEYPLGWGDPHKTEKICVSPIKFYHHVVENFEAYTLRIRDPKNQDDQDLRNLFLKRIDTVH